MTRDIRTLAKKTGQGINAFLNEVLRVFQTPFVGLPLVMWFFFVLAYIALPFNKVWLGNLPDSDDYTYLSQTLDWLQGQGWFDKFQHRMSPPEGVVLHYTRFADLPIAAVIMLFRLFHYSWRGAALLTAFLLPVIYLGVFFTVLRVVAERFVSKDWSRLSAFIVMFAPYLMFKFAPGQVDHHGLELILIISAIGLTTQVFARPGQTRWAVASASVFALSTAIALEVLPWMMLASAMIGLWAVSIGPKAARSAAVFGLSLFAFGSMFLVFNRSSATLLQPDLLSYSSAYVALMGGIAAALLGAAGTTIIKNVRIRFVLSGGIAVIIGAIYLDHFPALFAGPYGGMDPKLAALFFANLEEAISSIKHSGAVKTLISITAPALGLAVSLFLARTAKDSKRWNWLLMASFLAASIGLGVFYQIRILIYAEAFSVIPLVAFTQRGWAWITAHYEGRRRFWAEIWLILLVGPLTMVFLSALLDGRSFNVGVLLFPAQTTDKGCDMRGVEALLNEPPYKDGKQRIMNMIDEGSELIFATPHEVMSAPYHTNVRGNLDSMDFFRTTDPAKAEAIARRDGITLVVFCRRIPRMYLKKDAPQNVSESDKPSAQPDESFVMQIATNKIPSWLKEIFLPQPSNYSLFEVKFK